ncbi:MAG: hypothetical protein AAGE89_04085 [Pseudomonadota bacterium]
MSGINLNSSTYSALSGDMLLQQAKNDLQELKQEVGNKELSGKDAQILAKRSWKNNTAGRQQVIANFQKLCQKAAGGNADVEQALLSTLRKSVGDDVYSGQKGLKLNQTDKVMDNLITACRGMKALKVPVKLVNVQPNNPHPMGKFKSEFVNIKVNSYVNNNNNNNIQNNSSHQVNVQHHQQGNGNAQLNALLNFQLPSQPTVSSALQDNPYKITEDHEFPDLPNNVANFKLPPVIPNPENGLSYITKGNDSDTSSEVSNSEYGNNKMETKGFDAVENESLYENPNLNKGIATKGFDGSVDQNIQINDSGPKFADDDSELLYDNSGNNNNNVNAKPFNGPNNPNIEDINTGPNFPDDDSELLYSNNKMEAKPYNGPNNLNIQKNNKVSQFSDDDSELLYSNNNNNNNDVQKKVLNPDQMLHAQQMKKDHQTLSNINKSESLPFKERPQLMVGMGQGAVGPLKQLQIYSDSFSTCSPLVFYNSKTGIGGLFHVPAPGISNWQDSNYNKKHDNEVIVSHGDGVRQSIKDFIALVNPDRMILLPGQSGANKGNNNNNNSGGLPSAETTRYLKNDIEKMINEVGSNCNLEYYDNYPSEAVMVTTDPKNGGLTVDTDPSNAARKNDVDLLNSDGVLPKELQDKAVVRSHVEENDSAVLLGGSKFLKNAKAKEIQGDPVLKKANDMAKIGGDLVYDIEFTNIAYLSSDNDDEIRDHVGALKRVVADLGAFRPSKDNPDIPKDMIDTYQKELKIVQKYVNENK